VVDLELGQIDHYSTEVRVRIRLRTAGVRVRVRVRIRVRVGPHRGCMVKGKGQRVKGKW
jgi:hypothetical protein